MRLIPLIALLSVFQCQSLLADMIVNFGGSYVTSDQNLRGNDFLGNVNLDNDSTIDDAIGGWAFTTNTPFSPASNYSGTSATFYGGAIVGEINALTTSWTQYRIENSVVNNDSPHLHGSGGGQKNMHVAFLWKQADFLNSGLPFAFTSSSTVELELGQANASLLNAEIRVFLQDNTNKFWLSQETYTNPHNNKSYVWDGFTATSDGFWAEFDPNKRWVGGTPPLGETQFAEGTDLRFTAPTNWGSTKKFSGIKAIGFYVDHGDTFDSNIDFHFERFVVNTDALSTVPEPATMIQLSLAASIFAAARYRRRKLKAKAELAATPPSTLS
jgi:hypothetical protein